MKLERIKQIIKEEIDNVLNRKKHTYQFGYAYWHGPGPDQEYDGNSVEVTATSEDKARTLAYEKAVKDIANGISSYTKSRLFGTDRSRRIRGIERNMTLEKIDGVEQSRKTLDI